MTVAVALVAALVVVGVVVIIIVLSWCRRGTGEAQHRPRRGPRMALEMATGCASFAQENFLANEKPVTP